MNQATPGRIETLLGDASECWERDADRALALLQEAAAIDPWDARVYRRAGIIESDTGRLDDGASHLELAASLDPGNALFLYDLGVVRLRQGHDRAAIDALERALTLCGGYVDALLNLGVLYASIGDEIASVAALARTIDLDPTGMRAERASEALAQLAAATVTEAPMPNLIRRLMPKRVAVWEAVNLSLTQRFLRCRDVRTESLEKAGREFERLAGQLDNDTRGYCIVAETLSDIYFWLRQHDEAFRYSRRARSRLPCVRELIDPPPALPYVYESGKTKDAERYYATLVADLFDVSPNLVVSEAQQAGGRSELQSVQVWCSEEEPFRVLRGGNLFVITTPGGDEIEHLAYDIGRSLLSASVPATYA